LSNFLDFLLLEHGWVGSLDSLSELLWGGKNISTMALVSGTDVSGDEGADVVKDRSGGGDGGACALSHDISNFFENLVVNKLGKSSSVLSHLGEELVQVSELLVQCHEILLLLIDLSFGLFVLLLRTFLLLFDLNGNNESQTIRKARFKINQLTSSPVSDFLFNKIQRRKWTRSGNQTRTKRPRLACHYHTLLTESAFLSRASAASLKLWML
jgi:hypothetical protein